MTDTTAAVAAALSRQRQYRETGSVTMTASSAWRDASVLAAEVERLTRLHDAAERVVDYVDSALMDWQQPGSESHFAGVMEQAREAVEQYAVTRDATQPATAGE